MLHPPPLRARNPLDVMAKAPPKVPASIAALEATCYPSRNANHPTNPISHTHPKKPLS